MFSFLMALPIFLCMLSASFAQSAPTISIITPSASSTLSGKTQVTVLANSSQGIRIVEFYIDQKPIGSDYTSPYSSSFDPHRLGMSPGQHTLRVKASDEAGYSSWSSLPIYFNLNSIVTLERPAPFTEIASETQGEVYVSNSANLQHIEFSLISPTESIALGSDNTPPYNFTINPQTKSIPVGNYTLCAKVVENNGATHQTSIGVSIQPSDVNVQIIEPIADAVVKENVKGTVDVQSPTPIEIVIFYIGDKAFASDYTTPYNFTLYSRDFSNGDQTLRAVARNINGDTFEDSLPITIDNEPYKTIKSYAHFGFDPYLLDRSNPDPYALETYNAIIDYAAEHYDFIAGKKTNETSALIKLRARDKFKRNPLLIMYQNGTNVAYGDTWNWFAEAAHERNMIWRNAAGEELYLTESYLPIDIQNIQENNNFSEMLTMFMEPMSIDGPPRNTTTPISAYIDNNDGFFLDNIGGLIRETFFKNRAGVKTPPVGFDIQKHYDARDTIIRTLKSMPEMRNEKIYINGYTGWANFLDQPDKTGIEMVFEENGVAGADGLMFEGFSTFSATDYQLHNESRMKMHFDAAYKVQFGIDNDFNGKEILVLDYFDVQNQAARIYILANYLLVATEKSYYGPLIDREDHESTDLPEYFVDLGKHRDTWMRPVNGDGLYLRHYDKGLVLSNIDDHKTFYYNLGCIDCYEELELRGGGIVDRTRSQKGDVIWNILEDDDGIVDLKPKTARILRRR